MSDPKPGEGDRRAIANGTVHDKCLASIEEILRDPTASSWLKYALCSALRRDPVDAANDAEILAQLLARLCHEILIRSE